jgi:HSP20 family protein
MSEKKSQEVTKVETTEVAETLKPEAVVVPPTDLYEAGDAWILEADLPGVTRDRLSIEVDQGVLTLRGEAHTGRPGTLLHHEFSPVVYERRLRVGGQVDVEHISADLGHGVLTLRLPKAEQAKPRKISVAVNG